MIIKNNSKYILHVGKLSLNIGPNEVEENEWDKVKDHPLVKIWVEKKDIEIKEGSIKDVTKLHADEAIEVIEYTFDSKKLEEWKEKEDRKTVIAAIEKQLKELKEGGK